jgi:hypothetical protein
MRMSKPRRKESTSEEWRFRALRRVVALFAALVVSLTLAAAASADVSFTEAYGWGVSDGASQFETCTRTCQFGLYGGGAGQLHGPEEAIATDSSGDVVPMGSAARTMSEPSSQVAKQMRSLAASAAAQKSQRVLDDATLSPQVGRALRTSLSLKTFAGQMTPFEKSLVSAGALVSGAKYASVLEALRSTHKLTAGQNKTLARLLSAFDANPAVQVLIRRGKALEASPKRLAALLAALRAQPTSIVSKFPSTGIRDLDTVLSTVAGAVRSKATASVSKRFSTLLATSGAAKYIKALPPLDVAALVPAYELATYTLPSTARAAAVGTPPPTRSAWEAAVDSAEAELALAEAKLAIELATAKEEGHGPPQEALLELVETLEGTVETLEQGTVPPVLQLSPAAGGPWVAGVPYGFVVTGFSSNFVRMGSVPFGTVLGPTLEMTSGDGTCAGATCTANMEGPHTVTALVGGNSTSLTLDVTPAALQTISIQEVLPPFSDPATANVIGVPENYGVSGTDRFGNVITGLNATLSISPDGSCTGYTCTPTAAGPHTVTATDGSAEGTATVTVAGDTTVSGTITLSIQEAFSQVGPGYSDDTTISGSATYTLDNVPVTVTPGSNGATYSFAATNQSATASYQLSHQETDTATDSEPPTTCSELYTGEGAATLDGNINGSWGPTGTTMFLPGLVASLTFSGDCGPSGTLPSGDLGTAASCQSMSVNLGDGTCTGPWGTQPGTGVETWHLVLAGAS